MHVPQKVIVADKLALITEYWRPGVIAELNGQEVKLARLKGEFTSPEDRNQFIVDLQLPDAASLPA